MSRIIIVNQGATNLCHAVQNRLPKAIVYTDFHWQPQSDDIICWLPDDECRVDLAVSDLVTMLDENGVQPAKIIMKSVAGTADDAETNQISEWYGEGGSTMVMDHLYAIKMIDELEFPYTIVRTLPLTTHKVHRQLMMEGKPFSGQTSNIEQVADVIAKATQLEWFKNQSIGI